MDDKSDNYEEESEEYILSQLRETFRDEACELLAEIEAALLELEERPGDRELVDRVFRALHTIKGSGGTCEFTDVSSFAHELESFFDMVRKASRAAWEERVCAENVGHYYEGAAYYSDKDAHIPTANTPDF